jgi:hypothetical protein
MNDERSRGLSLFELLLLGMFGALIVAANLALRFPIKMPGHSGIAWMALLVTARAVVARPAAATTAALISGLLAAFLGMGDKGALDTFLSYTAAGVGVDLIAALLGHPEWALTCVLAGAVGNLVKLGVKVALELWIDIPTGFVLLGRLYPAATYTLFGLIGGYLGFLVLGALRKAGFFAYLAEKR